jgi:2-keto-3-deoxy-L-rhamnonate aldolase RhmA
MARSVGIWVKLPAPEVLEVVAGTGIDFVVIDGEHGAFDLRTTSTMVGLARSLGLRVLVRVLGHSRSDLQPPLDAGADGVLVPHVDSVADAERVVAACRFPPVGSRGGSLATRAGGWGATTVGDYVARGNREISVIAQIETPAAVAAAADIAETRGLDGLFLGPFDLALASGLRVDDPQFAAMVAEVERAASTTSLGTVADGFTRAEELFARGYDSVVVGADSGLLADAVAAAVRPLKTTKTTHMEDDHG